MLTFYAYSCKILLTLEWFMGISIKNTVRRLDYLQEVSPFIGKPFIKVLSGVRRCGKSSILSLLRDELIAQGAEAAHIIFINFESFAFSTLKTAEDLYRYIVERVQPKQRVYLLFDEIQEVEGWEKCINSFLVDFDADIYITGSNARLLSSELATYLAGRYIEIPIYTLSFAEYLQFQACYFPQRNITQRDAFPAYLRKGGFPVIHTADYGEQEAYKIVSDIYASVLLRDTIQRFNIRDIELLERVVKYTFDNIGNSFSGKNVADYFKNQKRKLDVNTIYNYLNALEAAFVLYRTSRYDIKGKELLKTQEKFYLSDVSLLYAILGYTDQKISGILENIVFLELKRRRYNVYIGKLGTKEIDFIAEKHGAKLYIQVAYKLESQETVNREFSPLLEIRDQYPKFVVTMDEFWQENVEGVRHFYITDFLLSKEY